MKGMLTSWASINAFITSRLDYRSSVLYGLSRPLSPYDKVSHLHKWLVADPQHWAVLAESVYTLLANRAIGEVMLYFQERLRPIWGFNKFLRPLQCKRFTVLCCSADHPPRRLLCNYWHEGCVFSDPDMACLPPAPLSSLPSHSVLPSTHSQGAWMLYCNSCIRRVFASPVT